MATFVFVHCICIVLFPFVILCITHFYLSLSFSLTLCLLGDWWCNSFYLLPLSFHFNYFWIVSFSLCLCVYLKADGVYLSPFALHELVLVSFTLFLSFLYLFVPVSVWRLRDVSLFFFTMYFSTIVSLPLLCLYVSI